MDRSNYHVVAAAFLTLSLIASVRSQDILKATCKIQSGSGLGTVSGTIDLSQPKSGGNVTLNLKLTGLPPNSPHGFHVHANASLANNCTAAAGHLNKDSTLHGAPNDTQDKRHTGDLGNIYADGSGNVAYSISDWLISLDPTHKYTCIGKPIVVHQLEDDLGRGGSELSNTTGNAGSRLGCCIIEATSSTVRLSTSASVMLIAAVLAFVLSSKLK